MNAEEKKLRLAALTEMFLGFGLEIPDDRLRIVANRTACIPWRIFRQSLFNAEAEYPSSFPPTGGQILAAAKRLDPGPVDHAGNYSDPGWLYRAKRALIEQESPRELGMRSGPGLMSADALEEAIGSHG